MVIAFPCKFQGNGCRTFSELIHKTSHEALCSFRPVSCQYAIRGCTQILLYHLMEKHVLECRFKPPTLNKMQSQLSVSSRDSQNWRQRKIFLIVLEDDQFFYQFATETIFIDDTITTTNLKNLQQHTRNYYTDVCPLFHSTNAFVLELYFTSLKIYWCTSPSSSCPVDWNSILSLVQCVCQTRNMTI